jgi:hypothetical protein
MSSMSSSMTLLAEADGLDKSEAAEDDGRAEEEGVAESEADCSWNASK